MYQFLCAVMFPVRVVRDALPRAVRVVFVVALIFAFDIVFPDAQRSISSSAAAAYTVTYDGQGGIANSSVTWTPGTSLTLPNPTRPGYTFKGWSDRPSGSTVVYETTTPSRSNGAIVYTNGLGRGQNDVAAKLTGADAVFNRVKYRMQATNKHTNVLTYAEVAFDKWNQNVTVADLAIPDRVVGNERIIATNVNNLSVKSDWTGYSNSAYGVTNGTGKSGRIELWPWDYQTAADGVYDAFDSTQGVDAYGSFQVHNLSDGETVLAWNRHNELHAPPDIGFGNYRLLYGGLVHPDWTFAQDAVFNSTNWKLQIYIGDTIPGGTVYTPSNNAGFTLYAQWSANTYTVTYNYNNATGGNGTSTSSFTTGGAAITLPTPTRTGHVFDGWYSDSGFTTSIGAAGASYSPTASVTAYAKWLKVLNVTYNTQLGSAINSATVLEGASITSSPGTPTRSNYTFKGWYAAASGGSAITFPYAHNRSTDFTLYAQWITNQSGFAITNAPAALAYQATVDLGTSGGNGNGAVVFATTSPSVCSVDASTGVVTMAAPSGTCDVAATKAADDDYYATSATASISATKANQSALSITGSMSATFGSTVSLGTSGGSTAGAVTWSVGSSTACSIASDGVVTITSGGGTCVVTASMDGNANYYSVSTSAHTITVSKANQAALTVTSTEVNYGRTLTLTSSGGSGSGPVTWSKVSGSADCFITGTATLHVGDVGSSCVVKVTKAADANYTERSSADTTIDVVKAAQTGFSITSDSELTTGSPLPLTAIGGQSTSSVSWAVSAGSCTISGTTLSASRGGITCTVTATKAGDANYLSTSDSLVVTVAKIMQSLTFKSTPPSPAIVGGSYTVNVESNAFLAATITITNQSQSVCSINAGIVTFTAVGTCVVSASQSGNDTYSTAAVSQSITVVTASSLNTINTAPQSQAAQPSISPSSSVAPSTTSTTIAAQSGLSAAAKGLAATSTTSTTTTSTTTTIPADPTVAQLGANGEPLEIAVGDTIAFVRGQKVNVIVEQIDGYVQMKLPNGVSIKIGAASKDSSSATVSSDGVLRVYRNAEVEVSITGLVPGTTYTFFMFSDPIELGRGVADSSGSITTMVAIPTDVEFGDHTLQVNGVGKGGEMVSMSLGFEVLNRESNTWVAVTAISLGVLLALLGGRPIFTRRRRRS